MSKEVLIHEFSAVIDGQDLDMLIELARWNNTGKTPSDWDLTGCVLGAIRDAHELVFNPKQV